MPPPAEPHGRRAAFAVVHLVRAMNGPEALAAFIASYRARRAGLAHDLVIAYKGFADDGALAAWTPLLAGIPHTALRFDDRGFDIGVWFAVLPAIANPYVCFLNSFARIEADDWLAKLAAPALRPGVGLVGATGSYESTSSAYRGILASEPPSLRRRLSAPFRAAFFHGLYPPFPNPHLRTNAFAIARELLARIRHGRLDAKWRTQAFESGRRGLTRQVLARGLRVLVVDRDGRTWPPATWAASRTFRSGAQENLLIADNRTDAYARAPATERERLRRLAWTRPAGA